MKPGSPEPGDRPCPPDRAEKRSQCLQTDRERYDRRKYCKAAGEKTCPGGSDTEWRGHGKRQFFQRRDSGTAGWQVRIWGNCSEATAKILNSYRLKDNSGRRYILIHPFTQDYFFQLSCSGIQRVLMIMNQAYVAKRQLFGYCNLKNLLFCQRF